MHLATLLLFCCVSATLDTTCSPSDQPTVIANHSEEVVTGKTATLSLPDAPVAKTETAATDSTSAEMIAPAGGPLLSAPVKPAARGTYETARQRKIWYGLMAAGHSAAVFDAYTTRRALSGNYGVESDPLMRPFAHSNAIYFATQASPAVMDYVGRRMMTSSHPWMRRMWWVPQVAGTGVSLSAGVHNYRVVP